MDSQLVQQILIDAVGPRNGRARPPKMIQCIREHLAQVNLTLYPDQDQLLVSVCEDIDNQEDAERAWSFVYDFGPRADELLRATPLEHQIEATAENVRRSTVGYINTHGSNDPNDWELASGVLIAIADRFFVATTAHSLPSIPQGKIALIFRRPMEMSRTRPAIPSHGRSDSEDIAYFEIARDFVEKLQVDPIPLSRIHPTGGLRDACTILCGYPAKFTGITRNFIGFGSLCWTLSSILDPKDWSFLHSSFAAPAPAVDLFLPYDLKMDVKASRPQFPNLPAPGGLSGGGIWQPQSRLPNDELWFPTRYCLIGVQKSWVEEGRYVRATQIHCWLRLLWRYQPELRPALSTAFPEVAW